MPVFLAAVTYAVLVLGFAGAPSTVYVGYSPKQPIPFSHAVHVGQLGLDCRYCHTTVETASFAALPPTQTCLNCHNETTKVLWDSPKLEPLRQAAATGDPIPWVKVHDLPDYAFFDHASHVTAGIGCVECHGRVDRMEQVRQAIPLAMASCLDCHRNPRKRLRPIDRVTDMSWLRTHATVAERQTRQGLIDRLPATRQLTDCSTCHR